MKLTLKNGKKLAVKDWMKVECEVHGVVTTYGELGPIARMALEEGLDTSADLPCLLVEAV